MDQWQLRNDAAHVGTLRAYSGLIGETNQHEENVRHLQEPAYEPKLPAPLPVNYVQQLQSKQALRCSSSSYITLEATRRQVRPLCRNLI